ncbi:MAG: hypothetical protein KGH88_06685 [Thaumarchaeota archaeon]|nr:hypothetical protein [Nitrososphaerota archaeon]
MKSLHIIIIATITLSALITSPQVFAQNLGGPIRISPYQLSQLAASGKNVYVTYQQNSYGGNTKSYFTMSSDGGNTFSQPVNLSDDVGTSYFSELSVEDSNVYVGWASIHGRYEQEFFTRSTDGGNTLSNPVSQTGETNAGVSQIVSSDRYVYLAGMAASGNIVWLKASSDQGADFGPLVNLNGGKGETEVSSLPFLCCVTDAIPQNGNPVSNCTRQIQTHDPGPLGRIHVSNHVLSYVYEG